VTSPPYFGLRKYEGEQVVNWPEVTYQPVAGLNERLTIDPWIGPLGAEPDIFQYIGHMVLICREIARVLRPDGTFWLNVGDSYSGSGGAGGDYGPGGIREGQPEYPGRSLEYLQSGDMIAMPMRMALALQADGWILRKDNIWAKDAMPEPVKGWRWERPACPCVTELRETLIQRQMEEQGVERHRVYEKAGTAIKPDPDCPRCHGSGRYGDHGLSEGSWRFTNSHEYVFQFSRRMQYFADHTRARTKSGANPRDVMYPQRTNYSGKHFAVFPPNLIAPLIHASVPPRCCAQCGKPWAPVIERGELVQKGGSSKGGRDKESIGLAGPQERRHSDGSSASQYSREWEQYEQIVTGYRQTCEHPPDHEPGWVLDPFMGSGTTGMVAREFGVNFIGCDISMEYLDEQAKIRSKTGQPSKALDGLPLFEGL